jgi:hypothetical protein
MEDNIAASAEAAKVAGAAAIAAAAGATITTDEVPCHHNLLVRIVGAEGTPDHYHCANKHCTIRLFRVPERMGFTVTGG